MREEMENVIAAICCATLGIIGLFVNISCVLLTVNIKSLNTSFGFLTLFHSLSNGVLISSYVFWVAPCILFDLSFLFGLNRSIGQMTIIAQAASYFSMLLLSTNRFVCVFLPMEYMNLFSNRTTLIYTCVFTTICLAYGCVYFVSSCYFIFDRESLEFTFSSSHCGTVLAYYMDFWFAISLFTVIYCLDISTLIKLRLIIRARNINLIYGSVNRFRKDLRFFAQTLCSTILFSFTVVCFHYISTRIVGRFPRFCSTTLIWGINHAGAGIIIAAFNSDIRRNIHRPLRPKYTSSGGTSSVQPYTRTQVSSIPMRRISTKNLGKTT